MERLMFFTGAGTSVESGIPTFRVDTKNTTAFWNAFDPLKVCDMLTFRTNREESFSFHNAFRKAVEKAQPNSFHHFVKQWQDECKARNIQLIVITQNVDDLFERAGVDDVLHVHGDIRYMQCLGRNHRWFVGFENLEYDGKCLVCDCRVCKPGVVFFNEIAPMYEPVLKTLKSLSRRDVLVVMGTSCTVFPIEPILHNGSVKKIFSGLQLPENVHEALWDHVILGQCTETIKHIKTIVEEHHKDLTDNPPPKPMERGKFRRGKKVVL